jgi:hypothetical protein
MYCSVWSAMVADESTSGTSIVMANWVVAAVWGAAEAMGRLYNKQQERTRSGKRSNNDTANNNNNNNE